MTFLDRARGAARLFGRLVNGIFRAAGWLFICTLILFGGFAYYARQWFSPTEARRLAAEQLTALLRREVTIERLVISPRGLRVEGLRVRSALPGSAADMLSCDSALVTVRLRPLLDHRLEFDSVVLSAPQIYLMRDENGTWDAAGIFGSSTSVVSAPEALPLALAAAETVIENGDLKVDDRQRGRKFSLHKLSLRIDSYSAGAPFPVEASFTTADVLSGREFAATVSASGRVDLASLRWSSATARTDRFRISAAGADFRGRVSIENFAAPRFAVELASPVLGPDQWMRLFGRDLPLTLPPSRWKAAIGLPATGMLEVESLSVDNVAGRATATGLLDLAGEEPSMSVDVSAPDLDLGRISHWHPALEGLGLTGRASLRTSATGNPTAPEIGETEVSVRGLSAEWDSRRIEDLDGNVDFLDGLARIKANVQRGRFRSFGESFDDLAFGLNLDKSALQIEKLSLRWGNSHLHLRARAEPPNAPKKVTLSGAIDKLDWDAAGRFAVKIKDAFNSSSTQTSPTDDSRPWLRTFKYSIPNGVPDTIGRLQIGDVHHLNFDCRNVEFQWSIHGVTPELDKIGGEARLSFGPGTVKDIPAAQDANKFLRVVFLPFIFMHKMNNLSALSGATAYPKSFDFRRIDGEYGASRGNATIRYFQVDSPQMIAYAEGVADLNRETVDMNILTRLTSYRGTLPEWWVDEAGRPAIGFRVKGDINKPDLEPRFKKIEEGEIERKIEEGRARARKRFENLERLQTQ